ncbi:hydrogenase [Halioglobus japonicus]|uniref:Aromatic ring-hydroxylating dioxygenase subunit alpha n=1 Tax=Halioglobus japonicus TaxID=930805 RepID=A0AAP8MF99_9GAMM|nr:aromatic ring-hydroxylating dioxygenase subunit alpha [Halioglobus japonicus]PLW86690.1 aromatic ring-hydroxylating dioxygenase subunit alpha [Halioglobus japonicus]GHD11563.1 hydrogenase [Halioglobus japonicus]
MAINFAALVNDDASLISRRCWSDQAVYEVEKQAIFGKAWLFLGHDSQIPNPGDFVQAYMCETPVILARGQDGHLHANINSCTHRGVPVCRADHGNTKRFVCPYHNWSFSVEGDLVAIPQEREVQCAPDKSQLGLKKVPRVETWRGMVFGSFNEDIEPLEAYLGDMRFYLDAFFERFPGGEVEFAGSPHRWVLDANWKLPVENQLGDVNHGSFLHSALIPREIQDTIAELGHSVVTTPGHGATFRLMPEDCPVEEVAWGFEGMAGALGGDEVQEYLREIQAHANERVGPIRARMKGLTYGVYPNLSFLWSNSSFKVSHPRGPGKVEYWSWPVVPASAPEHIKTKLRHNYNSFFGPGGMVEQEDAEVWVQQFRGANIDFADDRPFFYGLGMGEEGPHPDLPGQVSVTANEFYAREFFKRWRADLEAAEVRA